MNRTVSIALQNEDAWPFRIPLIFLDHDRIGDRPDKIVQNDIIRRKLPKAVQRHPNLATTNQRLHVAQKVAHLNVTYSSLASGAA